MQNKRFDSIISQVRHGGSVADIGCDHAYVSCKLVQLGISSRVYASDIRPGPLRAAVKNIEKYGLTSQITARLADGLDGIEDFAPDDIIIAGMGGELIAEIISKSEYTKTSGVNLILQPMTSTYELRLFLSKNGFDIINELLCRDSGKIYEIILCTFTGKPYEISEELLHVGIKTHSDPLFCEFVSNKTEKFSNIINGKRLSCTECDYECDIVKKLKILLEERAKR